MSAHRVNQLLTEADRLSPALRDWLVGGLQAWQAGQDLEAALCLDTPTMSKRERNEIICAVVADCPGVSRAAKMFYFVDVMAGEREPPNRTSRQFIHILQDSRVYVPAAPRHLRRILDGFMSDGWRRREAELMRE